MDKLRLATPEEIKSIEGESDLTASSRVLAYGKIIAVERIAPEVDPVFYNGVPTRERYAFLHAVSHFLLGGGANEFYFNIPASDTEYAGILEKLGAVRTSKEPEFRYKLSLT